MSVANVSATGCTSTDGQGGWLFTGVSVGSLVISGLASSNNTASRGGALAVQGAVASTQWAAISSSGDSAKEDGGFAWLSGSLGSLSLSQLSAVGCRAGRSGGCLCVSGTAKGLSVAQSSFVEGSSVAGNGGCVALNGTMDAVSLSAINAQGCRAGGPSVLCCGGSCDVKCMKVRPRNVHEPC